MTMTIFNESEQQHILDVKNRIQSFVSSCVISPWGMSLASPIDWGNVYLTGGAIASLLQGEQPKDWDFYFKDNLSMTIWKNTLLRDDIIKYVAEAKEYYDTLIARKMITTNCITMDNGASFITMISGDSKTVRESFDYVHCTPWYDLEEQKLYISRQMYDSIMQKKLIVNNTENCKEYRLNKFKKRGYSE